jgi:hypothetical protein
MPLYEALNRYALPCGEWSREGAFLHVRSHTWYFDRLSDLPDQQIREWATRLRERHRLELDDAVRLVTQFRDPQLLQLAQRLEEEGVHLGMNSLAFYTELQSGGKEVLRAYGALTPARQQALQAGVELASMELPIPARQWIEAAFERMERHGNILGLPETLDPGALSLSRARVEQTVVAVEEDGIRYRLRGLDGSTFGGNGVVVRSAAPPGFERGGQVTQEATFRYRYADEQVAQFTIQLPWAYLQPEVKAEPK